MLSLHIHKFIPKSVISKTTIFCEIFSISPFKKLIGKTSDKQNSQIVEVDANFQTENIFINEIIIYIYISSYFKGTLCLGKFLYTISKDVFEKGNKQNPINLSNDIGQISFSINYVPFNYQESVIKQIKEDVYDDCEFLLISSFANDIHSLSFVHISDTKKYMMVSSPEFNNLQYLKFQKITQDHSNHALLSIHKTSTIWNHFFIFLNMISPKFSRIEIKIAGKNRDFSLIGSKEYHFQNDDDPTKLYCLLSFDLNSNNQILIRDMNPYKIENIHQISQILVSKGFQDIIIPTNLPDFIMKVPPQEPYNYNTLPIPDTLNELRIFFQNVQLEQVDFSLVSVDSKNSIDEICFFNNKFISRFAVSFSSNPYHMYDSYAVLQLNKISKNINGFILVITSFKEISLSQMNPFLIIFADETEKTIYRFPFSIESNNPGYAFGYIERNGDHWIFKHINKSYPSSTPQGVSKLALNDIYSTDEEVEWQDA